MNIAVDSLPQSFQASINTAVKHCYSFDENIFWNREKPFKNVRKVYFGTGHWDCEENSRNLGELFPSMRHLDMHLISFSSSKCIEYHFPTLEHIGFPMYIRPNPFLHTYNSCEQNL